MGEGRWLAAVIKHYVWEGCSPCICATHCLHPSSESHFCLPVSRNFNKQKVQRLEGHLRCHRNLYLPCQLPAEPSTSPVMHQSLPPLVPAEYRFPLPLWLFIRVLPISIIVKKTYIVVVVVLISQISGFFLTLPLIAHLNLCLERTCQWNR